MGTKQQYTCSEYREEMMLLGLKNRLNDADLSEEEKRVIIEDIKKLEVATCMD